MREETGMTDLQKSFVEKRQVATIIGAVVMLLTLIFALIFSAPFLMVFGAIALVGGLLFDLVNEITGYGL
jgi:hypothetical protein